MSTAPLTPRAVAEIGAAVLVLASTPDAESVAALVNRGDGAELIAAFPPKPGTSSAKHVVRTDRSDGLRLEFTTRADVAPQQTVCVARQLLAELVDLLAADTRCQPAAT